MIDQKTLKENLHYNPDSGLFIRLTSNSNRIKVGDIAGSATSDGYIRMCVLGKHYKAHRLAFLWMTGEFPEECDHINHVKDDNRWSNLRSVTRTQNNQNHSIQSNNTSEFVGVYWFKRDKKWRAYITVNQKQIHLGYFDKKEDAISARKEANIKYDFHRNHGAAA